MWRLSCAPIWCTRTESVNLCTILVHRGLFIIRNTQFGSHREAVARGPHRDRVFATHPTTLVKSQLLILFFHNVKYFHFTMWEVRQVRQINWESFSFKNELSMSYERFDGLDGVDGLISYFFLTLKKKNKEVGVKWKTSPSTPSTPSNFLGGARKINCLH